MKKRIFALVSLLGLLLTGASAQVTNVNDYDNVVYVENTKAVANSQVELSVQLNNTDSLTGYEFNLSLPEGITVATEDNEYLIELSTERTSYKNHNIFDFNDKPDGTIYVLCNSTKSKTFSGNSGEVAIITVEIGDVKPGTYYVTLQNEKLSNVKAENINVGDITSAIIVADNGDVKLNAYGLATFSSNSERRVPAGVTAYTASVDEDNKIITWNSIDDGVIPAGEGVLLKGEADANITLTESSLGKAKIEGNDLMANLSENNKSSLGSFVYVLSGNAIVRLAEEGTLAPYKAYLNLTKYVTSGITNAKGFIFTWNDNATGITSAKSTATGKTYNLKGIRIQSDAEGIVIKDGKIQINKN